MAKSPIMFSISEEMREALDKEAGRRNVVRSSLIRTAIAKEINFDLSKADARTPRPRKYETPEIRKAAEKSRAAKKRKVLNQILEAYNSGESEDAIKALVRSLKNKVE